MTDEEKTGENYSVVEAKKNTDQSEKKSASEKGKVAVWAGKIAVTVLPKRLTTAPPVPTERASSREFATKNPISILLFSWASHLIWISSIRQLEINDVPKLNPRRSVDIKAPVMKSYFENYQKTKKSRPLFRALVRTYWRDFTFALGCEFIGVHIRLTNVVLLRLIVIYLIDCSTAIRTGNGGGPSLGHGVGLIAASTGLLWLSGTFRVHAENRMNILGGQVRTLLISTMFQKSMSISSIAKKPVREDQSKKSVFRRWISKFEDRKETETTAAVQSREQSGFGFQSSSWTEGETIQLMNTDSERIELAIANLNRAWPVLVCLPYVLGMSWWVSGWPGITATALCILCIPVTLMTVVIIRKLQIKTNKATDARVTFVNDLINGIRLLRIFGWEDIYLKKLIPIRNSELKPQKYSAFVRGVLAMEGLFIVRAASLIAFVLFSINNNINKTENIVPLLDILKNYAYFLQFAPVSLGFIVNALISLGRIEDYLLAKDRTKTQYQAEIEPQKHAVEMRNAKFTWTAAQLNSNVEAEKNMTDVVENQPFTLDELNLSLAKGQLIAVVGRVGCGKSSLLSAIVGDMERVSGTIAVESVPAYCPQAPWIQSASVKDNILFGKPFDKDYYESVLSVCALPADLELFAAGDNTMLGEKGINLSGGQKQRVHLARTLYQQSNLILLDDPLSAVDVHTGEHIFENAITGLCKNTCRILATHQIQFLARADLVLYMVEGSIAARGTYEDLRRDNADFADYVGSIQQSEVAETNEDDLDEKSKSSKEVIKAAPTEIMEKEERGIKSITWKSYLEYLKNSRITTRFWVSMVAVAVSQVANVMPNLVLAWWSADSFHLHARDYIALCIVVILVHLSLWIYFFTECRVVLLRASGFTTEMAMNSVLHAPISFFDTTPTGRILNRFTVDVSVTDSVLSDAMWRYILSVLAMASIVGLTVAYIPLVAAIIIPWALIGAIILFYYKHTPLELRRLEALRSSIMVAKLSEGISGQSCIRSSRRVGEFTNDLNGSINELNSLHFQAFACASWAQIRANTVSYMLFAIIGLLLMKKRYTFQPSVSVVVLLLSEEVLVYITNLVIVASDLQKAMNASERLRYYANSLPQEASRHVVGFNESEKNQWPQHGGIKIDSVVMRYRAELPPALKGLTFYIQPGSKVAIVGRTGAGKSSIMTALLRIVELTSGKIEIDGVDISKIGLHDLRTKISVIPQDPTLFAGTIRSNLDPEGKIDDFTLNRALQNSALVSVSPEMSRRTSLTSLSNTNKALKQDKLGLDSPVEPSGKNLSHGQRQLMALARALARDSKIIISDEATSSVDLDTDARIQNTLRNGFKDKTVLTIAHRLATVLHYDRIVVLDQGTVVEYDTPLNLFRLEGGIFRSMCEKAMITEERFVDNYQK